MLWYPLPLLFCKAGEFCYFKHFLSRYFALCLHFESNSFLLFRLEDWSAFNMWYFSVIQRSQCLAPGPLGNPLAWMCHVILCGVFSSFNFQTYVDRVVPALSLDLKSSTCSPFLFFRPLEVDPMYFITFSSVDPGFEVTSALYTQYILMRHLFSNRHKLAFSFGQLQSLGFGFFFSARIFLLWALKC